MSRRTGQKGTVVHHSKTWDPKGPAYGKYWADQSGCPYRKRRTVSLGICATRSIARQRLREYLEREGINSKQAFQQNTAPAIMFRQQAEWWLESLHNRKRRPLTLATISGWKDALNAWLLPNVGNKLLSEVSNAVVRELVEKMSDAGLSAKTIFNYVQVVKLVVASAVDKEGEQVYPRKWNHDFIQLPVVCKEKQHRPTVTEADLGAILPGVKPKYAVLFTLLAGTGLRIGEALALRRTDFGPDCRVLHVRRSIWRGREQEPKTSNAIRAVDIPETLACVVRSYVAGIGGSVCDRAGQPATTVQCSSSPTQRETCRAPRVPPLTWLRKNGFPKDLERYWMGHAPEEVGDLYSKLKEDVAFRQIWVERTGLGFELVHVGPQNAAAGETATVA